MLKYGTDKPDLRNPLIVHDVGEQFRGSGFGLFAKIVDGGGVVRAVAAPNTAEKSRKFFDDMNEWARGEGFAGLGYATRKAGEWGGPIAKNHGTDGMDALAEAMGLGPDDGIFFAAGKEAERPSSPASRGPALASSSTSSKRTRSASAGSSISRCSNITRSRRSRLQPQPLLDAAGRARGAGDQGSARHPRLAVRHRLQRRGAVARARSATTARTSCTRRSRSPATPSDEVDTNFPGMINAFKYGAPPHGGSAPGIDRIVMLLAGEPNIREVVLFPMNQKAEDLMMNAPAPVSERQLKELRSSWWKRATASG